jgi:hypothetical protein
MGAVTSKFFGDALHGHHPEIIPYFPKTKKPRRAQNISSAEFSPAQALA